MIQISTCKFILLDVAVEKNTRQVLKKIYS